MSEKDEELAATRAQVFELVSLFPEMIRDFVGHGLLGKAIDKGLVEVHATDPRDFVEGKYKSVDDTPFGGGPGMVMQAEPVARAIESIEAARGASLRILLTPSAPSFSQRDAEWLATHSHITLLCGRYEGIDDRIREQMIDRAYALGDFVLNGGEVAALALVEAVSRLREGVLGNESSANKESFAVEPGSAMRLEHPQYTKPASWRGHEVPATLLGGDHGRIDRWRAHAALARTWALRPELRLRRRLGSAPSITIALLRAPEHALDAGTLAALTCWVETPGVQCVSVGKGRAPSGWSRARDLRDLRRSLRQAGRGEPRLLRWVPGGRWGPDCLGPEALADALWREDPDIDPLGPLVLLVGAGPISTQPAIEASFAPQRPERLSPAEARKKDLIRGVNALAIGDALIDISQPASPRDAPLETWARHAAESLGRISSSPSRS